jgi:hypothetical protein
VPPGSCTALLLLGRFTRSGGTSNDGYADAKHTGTSGEVT